MIGNEDIDLRLADVTEASVVGEAVEVRPAPELPKGVSEEAAVVLRQVASELARKLEAVSGSEKLEAVDSISNLGIQAQRGAASEFDLLRARVGDMITKDGAGGAIVKEMTELRLTLAKISPYPAEQKGVLARVLRGGPFGLRSSAARGILERIAARYEPVSKQIVIIESRLRDGRVVLARDNIELRKLYESVESKHLTILRNVYLGEQLMQELEKLYARTEDPVKRERLRNTLHEVSLRVQDLRTIVEVDLQFFVSIDMTRENNTRLGHAVERTLALCTSVVTVGLAMQVALSRQKRVMEANQRTRDFLGSMIATNAAVIKQHTSEIGDAYNNPVIAIEKLSQAHNDLVEALDTADRTRQEGIDSARETIATLAQMSGALEQRAQAMLDSSRRSVEAPGQAPARARVRGCRLGEAVVGGVGSRLNAVVDADLSVDVLHVALDGPGAYDEALGDLTVAVALGHESEYLSLTSAEAVVDGGAGGLARCPGQRGEGRGRLQQQILYRPDDAVEVTAGGRQGGALEEKQAPFGHLGGELADVSNVDHGELARMEDRRGHRERGKQLGHVGVGHVDVELLDGLLIRALAHQVCDLVRRIASRPADEGGRARLGVEVPVLVEQAANCRDRRQGAVLAEVRVRAPQQEAGDALRVSHSVRDGGRPRVEGGENGEAVELEAVDDGLHVGDLSRDAVVVGVAVREAGAAAVVADEAADRA